MPPEPPKPPPMRLILEDHPFQRGPTLCAECGSSEKRAWFGFGKVIGCIQPECTEYYGYKNLPAGINPPPLNRVKPPAPPCPPMKIKRFSLTEGKTKSLVKMTEGYQPMSGRPSSPPPAGGAAVTRKAGRPQTACLALMKAIEAEIELRKGTSS